MEVNVKKLKNQIKLQSVNLYLVYLDNVFKFRTTNDNFSKFKSSHIESKFSTYCSDGTGRDVYI